MNFGHAIQYATLLSLLMGGLGVVVAVLNHREQVKTQIFLAMSAQYDELLKNSSSEFWLSVPVGTELPRRAPMQALCYAQIGGLAVATFITLLLVPVLYSIFVLDLKIIRWETKQPPAETGARPAPEMGLHTSR